MDDTDEVQDKVGAFIRAFYAARYLKSDNTPCQIDQGLYLGSYGVAHNKDALKDLNITHVLVVAKSLDPPYPNDFIYKKIEVLDSPGTKLDRYFEECFSFIDEAKSAEGGVLVHCFAGQSRSATIVIAYLMKKHRMSFSQALEHVKTKRPQIAPNVGFILQLQKFEKSLGEVKKDANREETS